MVAQLSAELRDFGRAVVGDVYDRFHDTELSTDPSLLRLVAGLGPDIIPAPGPEPEPKLEQGQRLSPRLFQGSE